MYNSSFILSFCPRAIYFFKLLLKSNSSSFIIAHNHPSGNRNPSNSDDHITKKLKKGADLLDIHVLDHIIIADVDYYSYADEGKF